MRAVNTRLARHGRKLGPDPASEIACTIGGVVANNSSGMACGIEQNTYRTLDSVVIVLPSGTVLDTGADDADELLRAQEPAIHAGLAELRDRVRGDPASVETVRALYSIKNTMGYGVNAFLDHDRPVDILEHLVVGSEGTLRVRRRGDLPHGAAEDPCRDGAAVLPRPGCGDEFAAGPGRRRIRDHRAARRDQPAGRPAPTPRPRKNSAASSSTSTPPLLVEYQEATAADLDLRIAQAPEVFAALTLDRPAALATDAGDPRAPLAHPRGSVHAPSPATGRRARPLCSKTSRCRSSGCARPASASPGCSRCTATRSR